MAWKRTWTPERTARFVEQWNDGVPVEQIGIAFNLHPAAASKHAARIGLDRRNAPCEPWTAKEDAMLRVMWPDPDVLGWQMRERLGKPKDDIIGRAKHLGLPKKRFSLYRGTSHLKKAPSRWSPERNEHLRWMWMEQGATLQEIGNDLGIQKCAVFEQRQKLGLPSAKERDGVRSVAAWWKRKHPQARSAEDKRIREQMKKAANDDTKFRETG
jgi:hypothetical protein